MSIKRTLRMHFPAALRLAHKTFNVYSEAVTPYLPDPSMRILPEFRVGSSPTLSSVTTQLCTAAQFDEPEYAQWIAAIAEPEHRHRKQWEYVYILAALAQSGAVRPGARGLGFGCGTEPMVAYFAKHGCKILATDMPSDMAAGTTWTESNQHAQSTNALNDRGICDPATFRESVSFRFVDMNDVPDDLSGFDFLWSSCALEHLGSLKHGLDFIKTSLKCLKPGGIAVHTTEFNLSSLDRTCEAPDVSFYRKKDIESLIDDLRSVARIDTPNFCAVSHADDMIVLRRPFTGRPHYKMFLRGHVITSVGIVLHKL